jgi:protein-disulfide isomerase
MDWLKVFFGLVVATGLGCGAAAADTDPAAEAEYARLLALVEQQRSPVKQARGSLSYLGKPQLGDPAAPVVVVEFGSFRCPYCRRHAAKTLPLLLEHVERGELVYVFHDFSRTEDGKLSLEAALCAHDQDAYVPYRQALLAAQTRLSRDVLETMADTIGLQQGAFRTCLEEQRHRAAASGQFTTATTLSVRGTPTFFIGTTNPDSGEITLTRRIDGAQPYDTFAREIAVLIGDS